jgi:hypothetical protein
LKKPITAATAADRHRRGRALAAVLAAAVLLATIVALRRPLFQGNFAVVDPGRVYRAAQPGAELERLIDALHLASIVNLRGGSLSDAWFASEVRVCRERGVAYYDRPMRATRRPSRRELLDLLDLLDRCRYPLLIHCKSGADRTGLASGLYLMVRKGQPPGQALRAFSWAHGHVPLGGPEHLQEPFHEYGAWLKAHRLAHLPDRFRSWVEREYRDRVPANDSPDWAARDSRPRLSADRNPPRR